MDLGLVDSFRRLGVVLCDHVLAEPILLANNINPFERFPVVTGYHYDNMLLKIYETNCY